MWGPETLGGRLVLPFPARDGVFAGIPKGEDELILQFDRLRTGFLAVPKGSQWWLEYYPGLSERLETQAQLIFEDDHLSVYALKDPAKRRSTEP